MNWGGFASGFSQGFGNGMQIGKSITEAIKQKKLEDVRAQGIAEATAARDKAVEGSVRENSIDSATPATAASTEQPAQPAATPTPEKPAPQAVTQPTPVDASVDGAPQPDAPAPSVTESARPAPTPAPAPAPAEPAPAPAAKDAPATPAAQGITTPAKPMPFTVNGKGFATREEALAHAKANAPSVMDFLGKTLVPKMQEAYVAQGDIEKAEAWGKWAEQRQNKKNMETWGKAYRAAQIGNWEAAGDHFMELYKGYDDGVTPMSKENVKDKDGNITGFNVKLKNDTTGEVRSQFIGREQLVEAGLSALSPPALFEQTWKRQQEAQKLGAQARIAEQKDNRTFNREMTKQQYIENRADKRAEATDRRAAAKDERQHGYRLEELATKDEFEKAGYGAKKKAELQAEIDIAKENGADDAEVKALVRSRLGGGYKKTTDPSERRALVTSDLMKNDPTFTRAKPEEQAGKVDRMMKLIYGDEGQAAKPDAKAGSAGPAIGSAAPSGLADGVYRDKATNQVFRVQGGKVVPVK